MEAQLEIPTIGQQLQTLADWKKAHGIQTKKEWHGGFKAWVGFIEATEKTEKVAILTLCKRINLTPPMRWD